MNFAYVGALLNYEQKNVSYRLGQEAECVVRLLDEDGQIREIMLRLLTLPQCVLSDVFGWVHNYRGWGIHPGYTPCWSDSPISVINRLAFITHFVAHELMDDGSPAILYWRFSSVEERVGRIIDRVLCTPEEGTHAFIYNDREVQGVPYPKGQDQLEAATFDSTLRVIHQCWGHELDYLRSARHWSKEEAEDLTAEKLLVRDPVTNVIRSWLADLGHEVVWEDKHGQDPDEDETE